MAIIHSGQSADCLLFFYFIRKIREKLFSFVAEATEESSSLSYTDSVKGTQLTMKGSNDMKKKLDLNKSVYELVKEYPELKDLLKELGFAEITKPGMLQSMGRMTTIPKGAKMRGISMMEVVPALMSHGYELTGKMPDLSVMAGHGAGEMTEQEAQNQAEEEIASTTETLKGYLKRLGQGEELEAVRADFVDKFSSVEASEIMKAEQELMQEGTPLEEVQKLCDVHSALFHGATKEEQIANAEKAVEESLKKEKAAGAAEETTEADAAGAESQKTGAEASDTEHAPRAEAYVQKHAAAKALRETAGHPLAGLTEENERIKEQILLVQKTLDEGEDAGEQLSDLRQLSIHYAKKGDLLYPVLKVRYDISGPSDVMWTVDDEIRDELSVLDKNKVHDQEWADRAQAVLTRADEMIYKEENILFPICAVNFSEEEWMGIYEDSKDYAPVFGVETTWEQAEAWMEAKKQKAQTAIQDGEVLLGGGHMTVAQLDAMLNTLPVEVSFVDDQNINRYFNEGPKVFKRPQMAVDREVFSCHPPKIEKMVRSILDSFRNGTQDRVPVWMEKNGKPFLVTYMAVRDKKGQYLGTMEVVQDMQAAKEHFTS